MILTSIGEVGVHVGERAYVLRPSLYAMSQLGEPSEIVALYAAMMGEQPDMRDALAVIYACSDDDLTEVFGVWEAGSDGFAYRPGLADPAALVPLARCLLKHGITGALPELPRPADAEPEYVHEFDARQHVALAMAHLGVSERDAWQMTMTSLVGALRAKFPQVQSDAPGARAPSVDEMEEVLAWHDRILMAKERQQ